MMNGSEIQEKVRPLTDLIKQLNAKVVFAESCTGGLVSALFTTIPGISEYYCGSFVTYRPNSKLDWLGVQEDIVKNFTCESEQMAREMSVRALEHTKEADYSVAVVGHLGPNSHVNDGHFWIGMADRTTIHSENPHLTHAYAGKLESESRVERQWEATFRTIQKFHEFIEQLSHTHSFMDKRNVTNNIGGWI